MNFNLKLGSQLGNVRIPCDETPLDRTKVTTDRGRSPVSKFTVVRRFLQQSSQKTALSLLQVPHFLFYLV